MITSAFLLLMFLIASGLIALLPLSDGLPSFTEAYVTQVFEYLNPWTFLIDFQLIVVLLSSWAVLEGSIALWHLVNWLIRKVPGMK